MTFDVLLHCVLINIRPSNRQHVNCYSSSSSIFKQCYTVANFPVPVFRCISAQSSRNAIVLRKSVQTRLIDYLKMLAYTTNMCV
jgi:hypothetical protein